MAQKTALVICPGRGSYTKEELGYFGRFGKNFKPFLDEIDEYRATKSQVSIQSMDRETSFKSSLMTPGENASALIYACAMGDYRSIDSKKIDVVGICGNSMGWYITLAASNAVSAKGGIEIVNTMGSMMADGLIGGQIIYPIVDENWKPSVSQEKEFWKIVEEIQIEKDSELYLSIRLGGFIVLGGNEVGLKKALDRLPKREGRYPFQLMNHGAFHTPMLKSISEKGFAALGESLFQKPELPIIDGQGKIWDPHSTDPIELRNYTLGHQVIEPYDFTRSVVVGMKELAPDCLILLGPGASLGAAIGQIIIQEKWNGVESKEEFQTMQKENPFLISMGRDNEKDLVT